MKSLVMLVSAVVVVAASVTPGLAQSSSEPKRQPGRAETQRPATGSGAAAKTDQACSEASAKLAEQLRTLDACVKSSKHGADAACKVALPAKPKTMPDRRGQRIAAANCPAGSGGGGGGASRIACYHAGDLVWCCDRGLCCDSAYGGYGCWRE
jgi:hypothetical protein